VLALPSGLNRSHPDRYRAIERGDLKTGGDNAISDGSASPRWSPARPAADAQGSG